MQQQAICHNYSILKYYYFIVFIGKVITVLSVIIKRGLSFNSKFIGNKATSAVTITWIRADGLEIPYSFQLVSQQVDLKGDGILGRDF